MRSDGVFAPKERLFILGARRLGPIGRPLLLSQSLQLIRHGWRLSAWHAVLLRRRFDTVVMDAALVCTERGLMGL